jgi:hypothetical protein
LSNNDPPILGVITILFYVLLVRTQTVRRRTTTNATNCAFDLVGIVRVGRDTIFLPLSYSELVIDWLLLLPKKLFVERNKRKEHRQAE